MLFGIEEKGRPLTNIKADLEQALKLIAPVNASLAIAIELKTFRRSTLQGSIQALRKAADLLEGIK